MPIPLIYPLQPIHDLLFVVRIQVIEFLQAKCNTENFHHFLEISIFKHGRIFKHLPHPNYPYLIPISSETITMFQK